MAQITLRSTEDSCADAFCASGSSPTAAPLPPGSTGSCTLQPPAQAAESTAAQIQYECVGPADAPVVVVLGGISGHRHLTANDVDPSPGWWEALVGNDRAIDTTRYRVVGLDYVGSPSTPIRPGASVTTIDQARALAHVLDALRVEQVAHFVGASYGGMVALAFAAEYPHRAGHLVLVGAAHRSHPMATAWRCLQRQIADFGAEHGSADDGLRIARGLAMTTYRSAAEFEGRFAKQPNEGEDFPVASYLDARGRAFAEVYDAASFNALSESIDRHHVDPARIRAHVDLIAVESDALVPPWLVRELRDRLPGSAKLHAVTSPTGHDAFLADPEAIAGTVRRVLATPGASAVSASTRAARSAVGVDTQHGAVMPPLYLSSNYTFEALGRKRVHDYSRTSNPTRDHLADAIADLEGAAGAAITSSGMSAVALVLQLLEPDDLLVATHDCYGERIGWPHGLPSAAVSGSSTRTSRATLGSRPPPRCNHGSSGSKHRATRCSASPTCARLRLPRPNVERCWP
ncbi:MAG: homoserine O-succinyltransferase [Acidobacteria bacterium]|nr:homoserine O-succinyltransferase [Acidobacteriota bacterium]